MFPYLSTAQYSITTTVHGTVYIILVDLTHPIILEPYYNNIDPILFNLVVAAACATKTGGVFRVAHYCNNST